MKGWIAMKFFQVFKKNREIEKQTVSSTDSNRSARIQVLLGQILQYIDDAENPEKQDIRYSLRDGWRDAYNNWQVANKHNLTFSQLVMAEIRRKDMTSVAFYTAAGLDRRLFSQMANDPNYQPSKRTAILCCLALKLDIHQAEHVLQLAGYALSRILREDLAARYCIQHGIWNVMDVMEVLDSVQENE